MGKALLEDSDSESSSSGGAELKVNEEFAKRFEYNKKREELQRLEEKHGKKRKRDEPESESESSSEDEDDEAEFATEALDQEIAATLNAIKSKDPRVYDATSTFYSEFDETAVPKKEKDKPVYLRDYHRDNLLNGQPEEEPLSYNQQQAQLKKSVIEGFHAAADSDSEDGGLLVRKEKQPAPKTVTVDVEQADKDPETFLSNFMAARAWVPTNQDLHPFESDDEEDEKRADEFEEAYNLRFEDPEKSNEKLQSYSRDVAAKFSVRREAENPRRKKRDAEKAAKEAAKQQRREEKARLKNLRMDEVEEKVKRIKKAAGLKSSDLQPEDWGRFIDDDWDDARWEQEMQTRFNDNYYAEQEDLSGSDDGKRKKPKKPKFDDDIDINDIVPDFREDDEAEFSLTDDEPKKSKKQSRIDAKRDSKRERRIIQQLVDDQLNMELDHALPASSRNKAAGFRYRETSPLSFGLTNRDILLADDSALNQFAGLKKLASWRDEDKKRKDKKHLGKKGRLRKWRADTFGDEEGLEAKELVYGKPSKDEASDDDGGVNIREGEKKKGRRRKKAKTAAVEA